MPNRRSLCDRRPHVRYPAPFPNVSDSEFAEVIAEQAAAPVCGACIVVASYIRGRAAVLLADTHYNGRDVYPPIPADAYRGLSETFWFNEFDDEPPSDMDDPAYYRTNITELIDDDWLRSAAAMESDALANWRLEMDRWRRSPPAPSRPRP
ncbi:hypothetical protein MycrhDRAFT_4244 [Mycolicibacterium rhodesiae JS60]|nr:hypothetical protein MycrhDRAFT_4244 [Mycolicibacterium rhodesiae JS60]